MTIAELEAPAPSPGNATPAELRAALVGLEAVLDPSETADYLGIAHTTLFAWRSRNVGPRWICLGDGRRGPVRYRAADLAQYLDDQTTDPCAA